MQKQFCIPKFVRDAWHGPTRFSLQSALRHAGITRDEFCDCWKAKIKSCEGTERGKKAFLELLRKGGIRACDNAAAKRLRRQIWFVNEVVRRNTSKPEAQVACKLCVHVRMNQSIWKAKYWLTCRNSFVFQRLFATRGMGQRESASSEHCVTQASHRPNFTIAGRPK